MFIHTYIYIYLYLFIYIYIYTCMRSVTPPILLWNHLTNHGISPIAPGRKSIDNQTNVSSKCPHVRAPFIKLHIQYPLGI